MAGYMFISNSNKPSCESCEPKPITLGNMSLPCLKAADKLGFKISMGVSANLVSDSNAPMPIDFFRSYIYRNPLDIKSNIKAYRAIRREMKSKDISLAHLNTPVGGLVGRLAAKKAGVKKVVYQAHGFHFFKGAPLKNWLLYYPAEKLLSHFTDAIITMNHEDFEAASKFKLKSGGKVYYVHGVGITLSEFENIGDFREQKRAELSLGAEDIMLISAGELSARKDYATAIRAIAKCENPKLHYFICGQGPNGQSLEALALELGVEKQIHFLGFRSDVRELMSAADIFLFTTLQEGLPRSLMEAMASGLACVASKIRGNVDLVENSVNGYLCPPRDDAAFSKAIENLADNKELREKMSKAGLEKIKDFDVSVVEKEIYDIYKELTE